MMTNDGLRWGWLLALVWLLGACGGGAKNEQQVDPQTGAQVPGANILRPYVGPPPSNDDVQRFRLQFFDVFRPDNRCGSCHGAGGQAPQFVREDDVNAAYAQALTVVNRNSPANSRVVTKVGGGHNCWISGGDAVCAGDLRRAIENWVNGGNGGATTIRLQLSDEQSNRDINLARQFPLAGSQGYGTALSRFQADVYPLFFDYGCEGCHQAGSATPQQPYFASADPAEAYDAALPRMDIDDGVLNRSLETALSRFVVRLRSESHNCHGDCAANARDMLAAIKTLAASVEMPDQLPPDWYTSKTLVLAADGIPASGGGRIDGGAIAKWDFSEGEGVLAADSSGVEPRMNLTLFGDAEWVGGNGIRLGAQGRAQATTAASKKLADRIKASSEYTIEAWVAPANVSQEGPARILTYSSGTSGRNFTLGQTGFSYEFLNRASGTGSNGEPALATDPAAKLLQATQQHLVLTYSPVSGRRLYVNGVDSGDPDPAAAGNLNGWDDGFAFVIGSEPSGARQWQGVVRFVAIYNRALTPEEIDTNFDAGVGEKFYLMFNVSEHLDIEDGFTSYVVFEASVFDSHSYLFNKPFFYRTGPEGARQAAYSDIPLARLRIGINGKEPAVGQAWASLDARLNSSGYGSMGQPLSELGSVLALETGPRHDEFFLTFERIGRHESVRVDGAVSLQVPTAAASAPQIGLRTFSAIHESMAKITGVPMTNANVTATYRAVKQQLPSTTAIETFVSAHQMAVAQLAIEYCSELVDSPALRGGFFPGFDFSAAVGAAFGDRSLIIDPLYRRAVGENLASQPAEGVMKDELDALMGRLIGRHGSGDAQATRNIVKATCAAALGSANLLLQ